MSWGQFAPLGACYERQSGGPLWANPSKKRQKRCSCSADSHSYALQPKMTNNVK